MTKHTSAGLYILDDQGKPVVEPDAVAWSKWFETVENRRIVVSSVGTLWISTVFFGMDHHCGLGNGTPLFYETMVFGLPDGEEMMCRYPTRAEALAGHAEIVKQLSNAEATT